ncbi:hypothetical protein JCM17960_29720 [Magnetospira thiophila]
MDPDDQAALRGDMLKRLVAGLLLRLEAESQGLDQDPAYLAEAEDHQRGLLYRAYMDRLRANIRIPEDKMARLIESTKDDPEALEPAKSVYISSQYKVMRALALQTLKERRHLVLHDDLLQLDTLPETVLAEADGLTLRLSDILGDSPMKTEDDLRLLRDRLYDRIELELIVGAAEAEHLDVSRDMETFRQERLPALLRERLEAQWINDEVLLDAFKAHPEVSYVPEIRHVAQVVLATPQEAEALRARVLAGESLYVLAGQYSIDPVGRHNNGDMGWQKEGTAMPEIEAALQGLADGEVSPVIATPLGYHLVAIYGRKKSQTRSFDVVSDRLRQMIGQERLTAFVNQLSTKFPVQWTLPMGQP